MKKNIITVLLALLVGALFAIYVFIQNKNEAYGMIIDENLISAFQIGIFSDEKNAFDLQKFHEGSIIVKEDDMYRVYIALLSDEKLVDSYRSECSKNNIEFYVKKIIVDNEILEYIKIKEQNITNNTSTWEEVNSQILSIYEDYNN